MGGVEVDTLSLSYVYTFKSVPRAFAHPAKVTPEWVSAGREGGSEAGIQ